MAWEYIKCAYCGYMNDRNTIDVDDFKNGFFTFVAESVMVLTPFRQIWLYSSI